MAHRLLFSTLAASALLLPCGAQAFTPVAPGNLQADVNGGVVHLTWDWGNAGDLTCFSDFEGEEFPPSGWELKTTYSYNPLGNWIQYNTGDEEVTVIHGGQSCAMLMLAEEGDENDPTSFHQDEWLIVKPGEGAVYMDFWYYLHPELLEVGGYYDFPDHYYVLISRDAGATWSELWDGRWDMGNQDSVQQASLFLGEEADENTLVAFRALSAEDDSLYFLWTIDDVEFRGASSEPAALSPRQVHAGAKPQLPANILTHRTFTPKDDARASRIAPEDWLNAGHTTFRIYRDNELIGDYIKARHFTDYEAKEEGLHTYSVLAWSEAEDREYAESRIDANVDKAIFNPVRNVRAHFEAIPGGKYDIWVDWDAPEGDRTPTTYIVYVNDKSIGWVDALDNERSMGQSSLYKGVYEFAVEAVYTYPDGSSEPVRSTVAPGTVLPPASLTLTADGSDHILSWQAPADADSRPESYTLYRGDTLLKENLADLTFTDSEAPAGNYTYHLHANYADGTRSLPATVSATREGFDAVTPPLEEDFTFGHLPENWSIELIDAYNNVKQMYSWRFDNWFDIDLPDEAGFTDGFASISGIAAGMNRLESYLVTPAIQFSADMTPTLSFQTRYIDTKPGPTGAAQYMLQYSLDDENWLDLRNLTDTPAGRIIIDMPELSGKRIRLRWCFLGRNSGVAAIDAVRISESDPSGIDNLPGNSDRFDILSLSGLLLHSSADSATLRTLPAGIYLLRSAQSTTKYVAR